MPDAKLPSPVAVHQDDGSWCVYDDNKFEGDINSLDIGRGDTRDEAIKNYIEAVEFDTGDLATNMIHACVVGILERKK